MQNRNNRVVATLVACCMLHAIGVTSQFVTFKDGQVGVNFGGYHAAAGLGGLLTGNGAHGGLSASAGTPWGPKAAAGLGGSVDGRTAGVAYAGAQANSDVGASAVLGGTAGEKGFAGSEAHANSKTKAKTISGVYVEHPVSTPAIALDDGNMIQKIKPTKKKHTLFKSQSQELPQQSHQQGKAEPCQQQGLKGQKGQCDHFSVDGDENYGLRANNGNVVSIVHLEREQRERHRQRKQEKRERRLLRRTHQLQAVEIANPKSSPAVTNDEVALVRSKHVVKSYAPAIPSTYGPPPQYPVVAQGPTGHVEGSKSVHINGNGAVNSALNIPIGILRSLQESLAGFRLDKTVSYTANAKHT